MSTRRQFRPLLVVGAVLLAACGGGGSDGASATDPPVTDPLAVATDPPATDPPVTDPPATDPPATDPPATDPPATDPPATDPPATDPPLDLAAFCDASDEFFVASLALDYIDATDAAATETLFDEMQAVLPTAIDTAPTADLAGPPTRVAELFEIVVPALEGVGYDSDRFDEITGEGGVSGELSEIGDIQDSLEMFLVAECGRATDDLETRAIALSESVAGPALEVVSVTDETDTIQVDIPADWTEVDGAPDDGTTQLVAAPNIDAFIEGFDAPGVIIAVGDADPGDEQWKLAIDDLTESAAEEGCSVVAGIPYDDGRYTGIESVLECPGSSADIRAIAGTNADETIVFFVAMVHPADQLEIRDLIVDSFVVD